MKSKEFCHFPFTQMLLQPTGAISPCCWNQDLVVGHIPTDRIEDIWNGPKMQSLRREFLQGQPTSCARQMRHVGCHRTSQRAFSSDLPLAEVMPGGPRRLDLRLNGKCNLRCIMCGVWKQPNGVYDQSDFWTAGPTSIFPFLEEIDMLGGEPFVQPDTFRLINEVSAVNTTCRWTFVTNAHYALKKHITAHLDKIYIRWIKVSLDSLQSDVYQRIRIGGQLSRVLTTVDDLAKYAGDRPPDRQFSMSLLMCVQKQNWQEVGPFLDYAKSKKMLGYLQFAYRPNEISLLSLSRPEREQALLHFASLTSKHANGVLNSLIMPLSESLRTDARGPAGEGLETIHAQVLD